jgi:hypothetical protein
MAYEPEDENDNQHETQNATKSAMSTAVTVIMAVRYQCRGRGFIRWPPFLGRREHRDVDSTGTVVTSFADADDPKTCLANEGRLRAATVARRA